MPSKNVSLFWTIVNHIPFAAFVSSPKNFWWPKCFCFDPREHDESTFGAQNDSKFPEMSKMAMKEWEAIIKRWELPNIHQPLTNFEQEPQFCDKIKAAIKSKSPFCREQDFVSAGVLGKGFQVAITKISTQSGWKISRELFCTPFRYGGLSNFYSCALRFVTARLQTGNPLRREKAPNSLP